MDISINTDKEIFRLRACAVILNKNSVLMVTNKTVDYYYSVGGAVLHGEKVEDAVLREVFEETGLKLKINKLLFVHQNYFKIKENEVYKTFHEVSFYFLLEYNEEKIKESSLNSLGFKEKLEWINFEDFKKLKVFPKFLPEFINEERNFEIITTIE